MKLDCQVKALNTKELTESQILRLHEVNQDMWAEGIGEFIRCRCCNKIYSKKDIFGHLKTELYNETVSKIIQILEIDELKCKECNGVTDFIYGEGNIKNIKKRLIENDESFLVVCENNEGEIVGFADGYISNNLSIIYKIELEAHYGNIGLTEIRNRIENALGFNPNELLVLSSIGLIKKYSSFINLFNLLKVFSEILPEHHLNTPGITELNQNNGLSTISEQIGSIPLGINIDSNLRKRISNTGDCYDSNLTIIPEAAKKYKKFFSQGWRGFIKLTKK